MSVPFTGATPHSGGHVAYSPEGSLLAVAVGQRLYIRDPQTLEVIKIHPCVDKIERIEWSPDSEYILCCMYKRATIQVFSIADPDWKCRINESAAGFVYASWAPDSRHIVSVSDFQVQLTVWSLIEQKSYYVPRPKAAPGCFAFNPSGTIMVVLQRREAKDYVGVYDCAHWTELANFRSHTVDAATVLCNQEAGGIVVVDGVLNYQTLVYSLDGDELSRIQPYERALGVKSVAASPTNSLIAMGSYDQVVRVMTPFTWKIAFEYAHIHPREMHQGVKCPSMRMYVEVAAATERATDGGWANFAVRDGLVLTTKPASEEDKRGVCYLPRTLSTLPTTRVDPRKPNPKMGVGLIAWSRDGRYLATRNDNMPTIMWIWDTASLGLRDMLVQLEPVRSAKWASQDDVLAFCTGNSRVYFWTPAGPSWVDVPLEDFQVLGLRWSPQGNQLTLVGKETFTTMEVSPGLLQPLDEAADYAAGVEVEHQQNVDDSNLSDDSSRRPELTV